MNAKKFLNDLDIALDINKVPEATRKEVVDDFKDHISLAIKSGKDENEVVVSLGDPYEISKDYISIDEGLTNGEKVNPNSFLQFVKGTISNVGVMLFNVIVSIFKIYFILIFQFFILAMMFAGVAIFAGGIASLLGLVFPSINKMILVGYNSGIVSRNIIMVCLGICCPILGVLIFKYFLSVNKRFIRSVYRDIQKKKFLINRRIRGGKIQ